MAGPARRRGEDAGAHYRSGRLRVAGVAAWWLLVMLLVSGLPGTRAVAATATFPELATDALALLNQERAAASLPPLSVDEGARLVAAARVEDMLARGYFAHFNPDGEGAESLLRGYGVPFDLLGENLARSGHAADQLVPAVHEALMRSSGHRPNMLEPRFHRVGIAVARTGTMYYLAYVFLD